MTPVQCPQCDHPAAPGAAVAGVCTRCGTRLDAMLGIELSQLTTLDDQGVDVVGRQPQAFAPPPQTFAPPPQASAAPQQTFAPPLPQVSALQGSAPPQQAFAPPPHGFAPARQAFAHSPQAFAAPPDAFAPPPDAVASAGEDADPPLGVERSTRAIRVENQWQVERVAKQAAASAPLPRPRGPIAGVVVALGLVAAVAIALVIIASR